ncbi:hypothetical protein, partial [Microbacterium sp. IEGM 1404]|uniref:hypothetical protein n=1 Tax=Microbacterium sp. IEGM 1404 TaxID=3047084 RepID=UPI0026E50F2E
APAPSLLTATTSVDPGPNLPAATAPARQPHRPAVRRQPDRRGPRPARPRQHAALHAAVPTASRASVTS